VKLDPGRRDGAAQSDGSPVVTTAWLAFGLAGLALTVAGVSLGLTIYQLRSQRVTLVTCECLED